MEILTVWPYFKYEYILWDLTSIARIVKSVEEHGLSTKAMEKWVTIFLPQLKLYCEALITIFLLLNNGDGVGYASSDSNIPVLSFILHTLLTINFGVK